ncbi:MAG TPA: MBOAT family protein [Acidimicrobiia bacterium]|nr:MBOAT family protein [Acidimicrobiia bacterium]
MLFNSFTYAIFLPVVFVLYWTVLRKRQNALLLVASYIFYGAWDWRFLGLLILSTTVDFYVGRALATQEDNAARKRLVGLSLLANLGILGFFKYFNFFADSFADVMGRFGLAPSTPALQIILPVGISFYTFQTLAYTIDVYRRKKEAEQSLLDFAVYVAFFPQLVAGPIERAQRLLPQITTPRTSLTYEQVRSGSFLILLGLVRKVVIADSLAPIVNETFRQADTAGAATLMVGIVAFALQIYGDFAGYSDIARGSSRLLGIELMENFNQPYLSRNITHFWRNWHISLSTWLRDYLYIPLGGNRKGIAKKYRNLMLTMLLGGLWHGAAWTFVVWGGLHGLYLVAHRWVPHISEKDHSDPFEWRDLLPAFITFNLVNVTWIFFRAESFSQAFDYLEGLVTLRSGRLVVREAVMLLLALTLSMGLDLIQRNMRSHTALQRLPALVRGFAYGSMILLVILWSGGAPVPFIYFQF